MNKLEAPLTIEEFSRRGGLARARKYSKKQLREWSKLGGKLGGRPRKKNGKDARREAESQ